MEERYMDRLGSADGSTWTQVDSSQVNLLSDADGYPGQVGTPILFV